MFDTHCHLDFEENEGERAGALRRARAAGVTDLLVPAVEPARWDALGRLAAREAGVHFSLGIHPWWLAKLPQRTLAMGLETLGSRARALGARAIGECGLDQPHARRGGASMDQQREAFGAHCEVARGLRLPLICHCVKAHEVLLSCLEPTGPLPAGGVLHSYSGPVELVNRYISLGFFFSFGPVITRPAARRPRAVLARIPAARLLFESDAPDQSTAPEQPRGEPAMLAQVIAAAAELRGEESQALAETSAARARRLFGL